MVGKKKQFALPLQLLLSDILISETLSDAYFLCHIFLSTSVLTGFLINFSWSFVHDALYCRVFTFSLFNEFTYSMLSCNVIYNTFDYNFLLHLAKSGFNFPKSGSYISWPWIISMDIAKSKPLVMTNFFICWKSFVGVFISTFTLWIMFANYI